VSVFTYFIYSYLCIYTCINLEKSEEDDDDDEKPEESGINLIVYIHILCVLCMQICVHICICNCLYQSNYIYEDDDDDEEKPEESGE
jgi:formate hydrogenlyase subunit 6/NADH:ubiquinone oxidoreductase subunit I